tara:strand:+ start:35789 stop:36694 length:906 start_codon:yes stop_codon:yes gene_type:complete
MSSDRTQAFFSFVKEREQIRLRKEADLPYPWTEDQILRDFKFTNVHRHHDRTSRELREQFYNQNFMADRKTILMNAATFRYFGTYEFASALGWTPFDQMDDDHWEKVKDLAEERMFNKERVFTGAYVITNQGISAPKQEVVVEYFLKALHKKAEELSEIARETDSWEQVATEMRKIQGFGGSGFMTKEILMDTTYANFWNHTLIDHDDGKFTFPKDWNEWTPIGPGARRGAARVLGDDEAKQLKEDKAFSVIWSLWFEREDHIPDIEMCLHDIQFQLCEFDKYERVRLGQGRPRSRYRAPK